MLNAVQCRQKSRFKGSQAATCLEKFFRISERHMVAATSPRSRDEVRRKCFAQLRFEQVNRAPKECPANYEWTQIGTVARFIDTQDQFFVFGFQIVLVAF